MEEINRVDIGYSATQKEWQAAIRRLDEMCVSIAKSMMQDDNPETQKKGRQFAEDFIMAYCAMCYVKDFCPDSVRFLP